MDMSLFYLITAILDFIIGAICWTQCENTLPSIVWSIILVILGIMQLIIAIHTKS